MLQGVGHLLNRHKGETVWICGTGPSLDDVEDSEITGPRIYLNRAAFGLPTKDGCSYWLVADDAWGKGIPGPWAKTLRGVLGNYSDLYGVFRNPLFGVDNTNVPPPRGDRCYLWHGKGDTGLLGKTREQVAMFNTLYMFAGTASPAIHLAWLMGASKIIIAGCDGSDGYASRLQQFYDQPARGGFGYMAAKADAVNIINRLGIECEDRSA